jgi:hypothetical protein
MKPDKVNRKLLFLVFLLLPLALFAQKATFGALTTIGAEAQFDSGNFEPQEAWTQVLSYIKFNGDAQGVFNLFTELRMTGLSSLYNKNADFGWDEGFKRFATDILFSPVAYYVRGEKDPHPAVDHFKLNVKNSWVNAEMGYKYAKIPTNKIALWETVSGNWDAGYAAADVRDGGYFAFYTGDNLSHIGPVNFKALAMPNRAADRMGTQYGFMGYINADYDGHFFGFQYNGAYGRKAYDTIFDEIYEADYIMGYTSKFGDLDVSANYLINSWGAYKKETSLGTYRELYSPFSSDVKNALPEAPAIDNMAAAAKFTYNLSAFNAGTVALGYRFRGSQANMMYVKEGDDDETQLTDQLGDRNLQRLYLEYGISPAAGLNVGLGIGPEIMLNNGDYLKDDIPRYLPYKNHNNMVFHIDPKFDYDLKEIRLNAKVTGYAEMTYRNAVEDKVKRGSSESPFVVSKVGLKVETGRLHPVVNGVEVLASIDNQNEDYLDNSYLVTVRLPKGWNVQGGLVFRVANEDVEEHKNPLGLFMAVNTRIQGLASRPFLYAQFLWNMNPYKSFVDGITSYNLDEYLPYLRRSEGKKYENNAAIRFGLRWDF